MEKKRKVYSREFKQEAVRLASEGSRCVAAVARDLGVAANSLRQWKLEEERHGERSFPGTGRSHDEELAQLRREVALLRQERDILKRQSGTLQWPHAEVSVHFRASRALAGAGGVPGAACSSERLLPLACQPFR